MRTKTKAELQESNDSLSKENTMLRQVLSDMVKGDWQSGGTLDRITWLTKGESDGPCRVVWGLARLAGSMGGLVVEYDGNNVDVRTLDDLLESVRSCEFFRHTYDGNDLIRLDFNSDLAVKAREIRSQVIRALTVKG